MAMFNVEMLPAEDARAVAVHFVSDCCWLLWIIIVSFPILISGAFVYITTGLLSFGIIGIVYLISWCFFEYLKYWIRSNNKTISRDAMDVQEIVTPLTIGWTLVIYFTWITQIVSVMELIDGKSWTDAYRFGFYGEYCQKINYFQWSKFNDYPWDIRLVVVSWFIF